MKALNICLVSPLPPPYGGITHWTSMIRKYSLDRDDAELVVVNTAPTWRSIHSNNLFLRSIGGGFQLVRDALHLTGTLFLHRFDVVHLTTSGHLAVVRDLVVSYIAAIFRVPLVYHIRFGRIPMESGKGSREWRWMYRVMQRATAVVIIDQATLRAVARYAPDVNTVLIPNCVDIAELPKPQQDPGEEKIALFAGWVVESKGISELVEAWARLNPEGWKLEIIGPVESDYRDKLISRFKPNKIEFTGSLSHTRTMKRIARCELFVFPSYTEGFPNSVVEAMVLGKAIIATDVGAIPEMLEGDAGVLIKSRDVDALTHAMEIVIGDPGLRERISTKAKEKATEQYSIDVIYNEYMALWGHVSSFEIKL